MSTVLETSDRLAALQDARLSRPRLDRRIPTGYDKLVAAILHFVTTRVAVMLKRTDNG